jgi:hypothetical protein
MNYSYYILRNNPDAILKLEEYVKNEEVFSRLVSVLIYRGVAVKREMFSDLGVDKYLDSQWSNFFATLRQDEIYLFNLNYYIDRQNRRVEIGGID